MGLLEKLKLTPPARSAQPAPAAKIGKLAEAAQAWLATQEQAGERVAALKQSVSAQCAGSHPAFIKAVATGLEKLDQVLGTVDQRLAVSLAKAAKAANDGARKTELKNAKAILTEYIVYVKSEPLVAHMDGNPFGVQTDLKALLIGGLTQAAKAIG